jgi:hypothetical protein
MDGHERRSSVTRRLQPLRLLSLVALAVIAAVVVSVVLGSSGDTSGSALDDRGSSGGAGGPVVPGEPLTFGLVTTKNVSGEPVELVSARLLWLDPGVKLLGFAAGTGGASGGVAITAREWPLLDSVPLEQSPPLEPNAKSDQVTIVFGLTVEAGREGKALGVVVRYRQNGKLKEQLFKEQAFVCAVQVLDPRATCPGHASNFDVAKDFDEELETRRRKG